MLNKIKTLSKIKKIFTGTERFFAYKLYGSSNACINLVGAPGVGKSYVADYLVREKLVAKESYVRIGCSYDSYYKELLINAILNESEISSSRIDVLKKRIEQDILLRNSVVGVIQDEGVLHHFAKILISWLEDGKNLRFFDGRGMVLCTADPNVIALRIMNRQQKTGVMLPYHKGKNLTELAMISSSIQDQRLYLGDLLQANGVPVLKLDTDSPNALAMTNEWLYSFS